MTKRPSILFGTLMTCLLILACCCAGCTSSPGSITPAPANPAGAVLPDTISLKNFAFTPSTLTIKPGTTVTWTNEDGTSHTVVSDSGTPVPFTSQTLVNGASFQFTFTRPGSYTYHCSIHPSMTGTIIVQS
jgi:plastocyanin